MDVRIVQAVYESIRIRSPVVLDETHLEGKSCDESTAPPPGPQRA
jgi:hypothetical protein